ncbi:ABC transporter permease [Teredinibacter turnerae]|uniref:ABC transporter permease n=1 Tax=Teredinibacter turnerae TaxID=2426 RepID=UPI0030CF17E8
MIASLAAKSLWARKVTVGLTIASITISIFVLLAIQHIRVEAKTNFTNTASGVDLIVGARTGQINLLLYSVFRIGNATNNIRWDSYQALASSKAVAWTIPISLGDSHRGFRVLGTTGSYFEHFQYANKRSLTFTQGSPFTGTFEAVLGHEVAARLGYKIGDKITLTHGISANSFSEHKHNPFTIVGILDATGTPVDQTVHVRLDGIEAIHKGWQSGVDLSKYTHISKDPNLTPSSITAFMVGLHSKLSTFTYQRKVNEFEKEALLAILPGIALSDLWRMMGTVENILTFISWLVLGAALIGLTTMMLAAMRERRHEFLVLRAVGSSPLFIFTLIQVESLIVVSMSICLAGLLLSSGLWLAQSFLVSQFGLTISPWVLTGDALVPMLLILGVTVVVSFLPAISAYGESRR